MRRTLYFAYGSNLDALQLGERCPSSRGLSRARLPHHRIDFTYFSSRWVGGAADIVPHSDRDVWGAVYELADADLVRLDRFEAGYDRMRCRIETGEETIEAITYTVRRKLNFRPTDIYLDKMLRWGERWELPADYLEDLRQVKVTRARGAGRLPTR